MENNQQVLEKIKKILGKTKNNSSTEEIEVAMLKAQELMAKHHLSMSDINFKEEKKEVTDTSIYESGRMAWWIKQLSMVIAKNFRCEPYITPGKISKLYFIGLKQDVDLSKEILNYAVNTIKYQSEAFCQRYKRPGFNVSGIKNDWIRGFLKGLEDKFKEQVKSKGYAIILVKDALVVKAVENKRLRKGQKSKVTTGRNAEANAAGYREGKGFQGERKRIDNSRMIKGGF